MSSAARTDTPKKLAAQTRPPPHRLIVRFPPDLWAKLYALQERGVQLALWIRRRVAEFLDREERS